jgi:outer membrane protein assembly factor BamB
LVIEHWSLGFDVARHSSFGFFTMQLAVVPIFVNAGAAILPAIIAGFTSLLALILSPRAMLALCRRKPWIPLILIAIIVSAIYLPRLLPAATPPQPVAKQIDWPAIARDLLAQQSTPHTILSPLWHNDLDGTQPLSTPALKDGTIYVPTTLRDTGGYTGSLYALDASTGRQKWLAIKDPNDAFLKPFFSSPAITPDGKFLVVGQGLHSDKDSPLICFNLQQAEPATSANPPEIKPAWSIQTSLHVESSPAIFTYNHKPYAVVGAGAIEGHDRLPVGNPGYVFCADITTGIEAWRYAIPDPESSPAVDENNIIYIGSGFNGNAVVALRPEPDNQLNGKPRELWKTKTPFPAVSNIALATSRSHGKIVLIGTGNGDYVFSDPNPAGIILALDRATGKIQWQTPLPDAVLGPLTTTRNMLLSPCRNGHAYALDLDTGKILWHTQVSQNPKIPVLAGLATDGPHAFALAADGTLAVLQTTTGQLLERTQLTDPTKSPEKLTLSNPIYDPPTKTLYIATETTALHAFKVNP